MANGYWIVHVTVNNPEPYQDYVRLDTPIIEKFGGKFLVRGGPSEDLEGVSKDRHVVVEFPDYETALKCYHSAEYQEVAKIRWDNAASDVVIVEGVA